jgi:hypothetical protein
MQIAYGFSLFLIGLKIALNLVTFSLSFSIHVRSALMSNAVRLSILIVNIVAMTKFNTFYLLGTFSNNQRIHSDVFFYNVNETPTTGFVVVGFYSMCV